LSNLDARLRLHMRDELRTLVKRSGMTAVYVTHDQKEALSMADRIAVMNAGHIVQVGSPEELYNRPATRFVADFLGEANFLDGELSAGGLVKTAVGEIRHGHAGGMAPGRAVTCCIRPERIVIETGNVLKATDDGNLVAATIISNIYLGEIRQFTCKLGDAQDIVWRISMLAHESPEVREGDSVQLRFAAEHCVLVER